MISDLCKVSKTPPSSYYHWLSKKDLKASKDKDVLDLILLIHKNSKGKVGIRSIKMILERDYGLIINLKKIQRIKQENKIYTVIRKKRPYMKIHLKNMENKVSPNLLKQDFKVSEPNKVYSTDISYLAYGKNRDKRAYLSATKDLATKEIVSYNVSNNLGLNIVFRDIEKAFKKLTQTEKRSLIIHSDQGYHYTNIYYISKLKKEGITQSMSRKGNCLDNAPIESFFGHMKDEIDLRSCKDFTDVEKMVANYINYYNNERYQWGLKRMTPKEYKCYLKSF